MKFILILIFLASCKGYEREMVVPTVGKKCSDSIKGEYNSYFDSVEKCIESDADLKKEKTKQVN